MENLLLSKFEKRENEEIRISLGEYKEHNYIDIRQYFVNEDGEWKFTKKGITIKPHQIDLLINCLQEAKTNLAQN